MTKTKMTVTRAVWLATLADVLFAQAANAWVRGNNSGDTKKNKKAVLLCRKLRDEAEALLSPLGIKVDYPGLYPTFKVRGFTEYTTLNAISAALEAKR